MATSELLTVEVAPAGEGFAARGARIVRDALEAADPFSLVLSGGGTPAPVYRRLAGETGGPDWSRGHIFFGDERSVPAEDEGSNYRMARETLLAGRPGAGRVHRIRGEAEPEEAAREYEEEIRRALGEDFRFTVVLLGLGPDGHTASLFPGSDALARTDRLVVPAAGPPPWPARVTLTFAALARARLVLFLVAGAKKAERAAEAIRQMRGEEAAVLPAARVRPQDGRVLWLLDEPAAGRVEAG